MQKIKTAALTGAALDWVVAKAEGNDCKNIHGNVALGLIPRYSTDWVQGGPIIEREGISLRPIRQPDHSLDGQWLAHIDHGNTGRMVQWVEFLSGGKNYRRFWRGDTALVAAMRCYVTNKLGDEVDVPEGLI